MHECRSACVFLMCAIGSLTVACSTDAAPIVSFKHSNDVMIEGAKAIASSEVLATGYCVDTRLDDRKTVLVGPKDAAGWSSGPDQSAEYRLLDSPKLGKLPTGAIASFPAGSIGIDCRHRLVLHEPEFVEIRRRGRSFIYAILTVDDRCPTCGAGYSLYFRKHGESWEVDASGLSPDWSS